MGLMYSVQFTGAITAQQDLFAIVAPSTAAILVHNLVLSQSSEVGDAMEEGLSILFKRGATTTGSGGSSVTPVPLETGYPASTATCRVNDTTKASGGTIVTLHSETWYVRGPFPGLATPEIRHVISPSQRYTVELATVPGDSISVNATLYYEQIGG